MRYSGGAKRALPVAADSHNGALGEEGVHPHPATPPRHAEAPIPDRQEEVSQE